MHFKKKKEKKKQDKLAYASIKSWIGSKPSLTIKPKTARAANIVYKAVG